MLTVPLRADLRQVIDDLDAIDRAVEALVAPLSDEQFFWQPDGGRAWSIAQCLEHLAVGNTVYCETIAQAVAAARARGVNGSSPIASTVFGRLFVWSLEPPVRFRVRAPGKILPRTTRSRSEILDAFFSVHDRERELIRAANEIDVNRTTFRNPFLPLRMRVGTALRVGPAHDRRHVWQAQNVTKAQGFPSRD